MVAAAGCEIPAGEQRWEEPAGCAISAGRESWAASTDAAEASDDINDGILEKAERDERSRVSIIQPGLANPRSELA